MYFADPKQDFLIEPVRSYRTADPVYVADLRPAKIEELWDELVTQYPDFVTKTVLGQDESGEFNINRYRISTPLPRDNNNVLVPGRKIKIMMETVHNELVNHAYILEFARMLLEQSSIPQIKSLLTCCEWSFIPVANPWGLANGFRQNSRGVDINSNFSQGWFVQGQQWDFQYSGPSPMSEVETRIVAEEMERFMPDIHMSCHSHGDQEPNGAFFWTVPNPSAGLNNTVWRGHMRAVMNLKERYPDIRPPEELMDIRSSNYPEGKGRSTDQAWSLGAISISHESGLTLDANGAAGVKGSVEAMTLNVMSCLFCILQCIDRVLYYGDGQKS